MAIATGVVADTPHEDWTVRSRALADQLMSELKTELGAALESGGPVVAIEVCRTRAPVIAARLSLPEAAVEPRTARGVERRPTGFEPGQLRGAVVVGRPAGD